MSINIDKLDFETISHEQIPYSMVHRQAVQQIKNTFAGYVWVYLTTLPKDWIINKYHLMKHFEVGEQKLKNGLAWLAKNNLIKYKRTRLKDGTLGKVTIHVLNGTAFIESLNHADNSTDCTNDTTGMKNHRVAEPPSGESDTYIEDIETTEKDKTTTTEKPIEESQIDEPPAIESSSSFIISEQADKTLLQARKGKTDERTNEEFLRQCKHHLENPSNAANFTLEQRLAGLCKLIKGTGFSTPAGYKPPKEAKKNETPFDKKQWDIINEFRHALKMVGWGGALESFFPIKEKLREAQNLFSRYQEIYG